MADLADAGILFLTDLAGSVTADVASPADAGLVTVGVADLADAGAVPLALPDMSFPEVGLVTMKAADEVDVTPIANCDQYGGLPSPDVTDMWCCGQISRRNGCPAMMIGSVHSDPHPVRTFYRIKCAL